MDFYINICAKKIKKRLGISSIAELTSGILTDRFGFFLFFFLHYCQ